jgi:hypothetical protein
MFMRVIRTLSQLLRQRHSVYARHANIQQEYVRPKFHDGLEGLLPIARFPRNFAVRHSAQHTAEPVPGGPFVIND